MDRIRQIVKKAMNDTIGSMALYRRGKLAEFSEAKREEISLLVLEGRYLEAEEMFQQELEKIEQVKNA